MRKIRFLSGNALKIIAAVSMVADHVGLLFFLQMEIFRIIGRLALPIFAFMIAEGCRYTKNKIRYFSMIFGLAFICQVVYYLFDGSLYMCILVTFSLSILALFSLENFKRIAFSKQSNPVLKVLAAGLFFAVVAFIYFANTYLKRYGIDIDYGFWGCMLPVFAGLFHMPENCNVPLLKKLDSHYTGVLMLALGLLPLMTKIGWVQPYSLLAIPLLLLYSGKRGKWKMKYFFYIFYPLHLVLLEGIYIFTVIMK
jgi:hypothetical protein